jgi:hypothetical protein
MLVCSRTGLPMGYRVFLQCAFWSLCFVMLQQVDMHVHGVTRALQPCLTCNTGMHRHSWYKQCNAYWPRHWIDVLNA